MTRNHWIETIEAMILIAVLLGIGWFTFSAFREVYGPGTLFWNDAERLTAPAGTNYPTPPPVNMTCGAPCQ